jgi:hypothetical protein
MNCLRQNRKLHISESINIRNLLTIYRKLYNNYISVIEDNNFNNLPNLEQYEKNAKLLYRKWSHYYIFVEFRGHIFQQLALCKKNNNITYDIYLHIRVIFLYKSRFVNCWLFSDRWNFFRTTKRIKTIKEGLYSISVSLFDWSYKVNRLCHCMIVVPLWLTTNV